jgi:NDP-sugar pyrophosphorylase family protein
MKAVILAGGLGSRLTPFTRVIPKPLLPIGESSVLEIQLLSLRNFGIKDVFIATNYLSNVVVACIGDGSKYDMNVRFSHEEQRLGTCGPLSLLRDQLDEPFVLMNGDVLTTMDFAKASAFAAGLDASLTIVTKEIVTPFAFGKVLAQDNYIVDVQEKPDVKFEILAGIYFFKPNALRYIPHNTFYNIDQLIREMLAAGDRVGRYLMQEYWLDIGEAQQYEAAQVAYDRHFQHLKASEQEARGAGEGH